MQKKLLALAIAGLSSAAFAQSNVTISGAIEAHFENISAKGATAAGADLTTRKRVTDNTSWLRFSGSENLGNGMAAFFQVESDLGIDGGAGAAVPAAATGAGFGNRNSGVGLKGGFGTVLMGHWDAQYQAQLEGGVDFGSSGALPHSANSMNLTSEINGTLVGGRLNNVVAYITPDFNGLSARLAWTASTENSTAGLTQKSSGLNLFVKYANGPINAFYAYLKAKDQTDGTGVVGVTTDDVTGNKLGVAYTFPMGLKLGVVWDKSKADDVVGTKLAERTAWSIPVSYTTGAHGIHFAYAKAGDVKTAAGSVANTGAKNLILGYTYSLSKRTQVGVSYSKITNESAATYGFWTRGTHTGAAALATPAGADPTSFTMGINHAF